MEENKNLIEQCTDFLRRSSRRYSKTLLRATKDLRRYSGGFWDDEYKKAYRKGKNRLCLSLNNWNVICNAIASPLSASPWHTELTNQEDENKQIQESIDAIEARNDVKTSLLDAFRKDVLSGYGFGVVSTDVDEFTGEPTIVLESVKHLQSVAMDPACVTTCGSDAEEGAIVNFVSLKRAKREWGEDIAPFDYPRSQPSLNINGMEQWGCPEDQIPVVSYYVKENDGVMFYKICGDKIVQQEKLPIKYIPIIRFAGNEIYEENGEINYNGIIQQTLNLELGANIAYSTLIERCGRSVKANYLINVDAIDGVEKSYANADNEDAVAVLWKGEHQPLPLTEQFQTGDLQSVITTTRTLMEDTVGVPLTGIPDGAPERTATEILRQQTSKESNTASYFQNAFAACQLISKIFIELLNGGIDLRFKLENGPAVITRQMKARQELTALAGMMPEEMKPLIAKFFADTLEDDVGKDLSRNILANLPKDILYLQDDAIDPGAVHQLEMMKATLDECMAQLDEQIAANGELQKELDTAEISMMESREQRLLDWQKFKISEQDRMALETAKLQQSSAGAEASFELDTAKLMVEAEKNQAKAQNDTDKVMLEAQKQTGEVEKAYADGEDSGYEQGVNDGVDAAFGR
jgi:hypothetical protein